MRGIEKLIVGFMVLSAFCRAGDGFALESSFPPSPIGVTFDLTTLINKAPGSDNWPVTWADDGNQYTSWGDGGGFGSESCRVSLGFARVEGDKDNYKGYNLWGCSTESSAEFGGKCHGIISIDGKLYMFRDGDASETSAFRFAELYRSSDHARTWSFTGLRFAGGDFNDHGIFAPTFCQFGMDYSGARDQYVYIYAPNIKNASSWEVQKPGEITLMRVQKTYIEDKTSYEYFAGFGEDRQPLWTPDPDQRKPVFKDDQHGVMRTSVSYNAGIKKYILITQQVSRQKTGNGHIGIYESAEPWGPWQTILFQNAWDTGLHTGTKTVFWNISNKWSSGNDFVLVYTGDGSDEWGTVEGKFTGVTSDSSPPAIPENLRILSIN